jgi:hypothetical protein
MGHLVCQLNQLIFHFTLDPAAAILAQNQEIRGVKDADLLAFFTGVHQLDGARLIVKFEDGWIMLKLINGGKFSAIALKLNGAPHFLTGIATTYIASATLDQARGR